MAVRIITKTERVGWYWIGWDRVASIVDRLKCFIGVQLEKTKFHLLFKTFNITFHSAYCSHIFCSLRLLYPLH
jgi:hypothetical protein